MRKRRRRRPGSPFSFSFLDVFACTLGALVFILVACALQGQGVTRAAAEAMEQEIEELEAALRRLEERLEQAETERESEAFDRDALRASNERSAARAARLEVELARAKAREEAAGARAAELAYTWGRLPDSVGSRVPLYLECREGKVWVQPAGPVEDAGQLSAADSRVGRALLALRGDPGRYAVLILRPGGFEIYRRVESLLGQLKLDYGRDAISGGVRIEGWRQ